MPLSYSTPTITRSVLVNRWKRRRRWNRRTPCLPCAATCRSPRSGRRCSLIWRRRRSRRRLHGLNHKRLVLPCCRSDIQPRLSIIQSWCKHHHTYRHWWTPSPVPSSHEYDLMSDYDEATKPNWKEKSDDDVIPRPPQSTAQDVPSTKEYKVSIWYVHLNQHWRNVTPSLPNIFSLWQWR